MGIIVRSRSPASQIVFQEATVASFRVVFIPSLKSSYKSMIHPVLFVFYFVDYIAKLSTLETLDWLMNAKLGRFWQEEVRSDLRYHE